MPPDRDPDPAPGTAPAPDPPEGAGETRKPKGDEPTTSDGKVPTTCRLCGGPVQFMAIPTGSAGFAGEPFRTYRCQNCGADHGVVD